MHTAELKASSESFRGTSIEFASEETNIGIAIFATGEIVAFWGSDADDSYARDGAGVC